MLVVDLYEELPFEDPFFPDDFELVFFFSAETVTFFKDRVP